MFSGKRFVTSGIAEKVPLLLQVIMWNMIDTMDKPRLFTSIRLIGRKRKTEDCSFTRTTGIHEGVSV